jgi:hypothetical protein
MTLDSEAGLPVLLITVFDPVEAEIIVAKLRSAGIEAMVRHEALSVVYGLTVDGCGQQDILVRPSDLEVARAALETSAEEIDDADSYQEGQAVEDGNRRTESGSPDESIAMEHVNPPEEAPQ